MKATLLKESHENLFLKEGYLLALQFDEGYVVFRIDGYEPTNLKPYSLGAVAASSNLAAWNDIIDSGSRHYLMPPASKFINHVFWGINKPKARIFFQYPTRQDRWSLTSVERVITGDVGYIDGEMSPFNGPFSMKTQIFTINELYPAFNCYNPLPDGMDNVLLNFDIMKYTYTVVKNKDVIRDVLTLKRPGRIHTVAGVDPQPASIPDWLKKNVGSDLVAYTKTVMAEGNA
jgi:hypothetical protein